MISRHEMIFSVMSYERKKPYSLRKKFRTYKKNTFKNVFCHKIFSYYRFLQVFQKIFNFYKSWLIFSGVIFSKFILFPF